MKKIIAILALICVAAVSGCGNSTPADTTADPAGTTTAAPASTDESGQKTMVAYSAEEEEDTTEQALAYLEEKAPLLKKYIDMRRTTPITFETTITNSAGEYKSGLYIKDETHIAQYTTDPSGNTVTVMYVGKKGYQIDNVNKKIYECEYGKAEIEEIYNSLGMTKLNIADVTASGYSDGVNEYEGTEYNRVSVTYESAPQNDFYFDMDTGKLAYIVSEGTVTHVEKIENSFTNDDIFELPDGYELKSYEELVAEYQAQLDEQNAADQTEAAE